VKTLGHYCNQVILLFRFFAIFGLMCGHSFAQSVTANPQQDRELLFARGHAVLKAEASSLVASAVSVQMSCPDQYGSFGRAIEVKKEAWLASCEKWIANQPKSLPRTVGVKESSEVYCSKSARPDDGIAALKNVRNRTEVLNCEVEHANNLKRFAGKASAEVDGEHFVSKNRNQRDLLTACVERLGFSGSVSADALGNCQKFFAEYDRFKGSVRRDNFMPQFSIPIK
jgi:hypothetical protein